MSHFHIQTEKNSWEDAYCIVNGSIMWFQSRLLFPFAEKIGSKMLTTTTIVWKYAEKISTFFHAFYLQKYSSSKYKYRYKVHFLQEMHKKLQHQCMNSYNKCIFIWFANCGYPGKIKTSILFLNGDIHKLRWQDSVDSWPSFPLPLRLQHK